MHDLERRGDESRHVVRRFGRQFGDLKFVRPLGFGGAGEEILARVQQTLLESQRTEQLQRPRARGDELRVEQEER
jgi:hypothetical protein